MTSTAAASYYFGIESTTLNFNHAGASTTTQSIAITTTGFLGIIEGASPANGAPVSVTFSCGLAPAPAPDDPHSSELLDQARKRFSTLAARTSATNIGESISAAITDAFSGAPTQVSARHILTGFASARRRDDDELQAAYGALGYDDLLAQTPSPAQAVASRWHTWLDVRGGGLDDDRASAFDGRHLNVTGGVAYRMSATLLLGGVVGYEDFNYELGLRNVELDGNGWTAGGYVGWKFWDRLRLDGMLIYSRISYDAQADAVTGDFDADRVTGMMRVSGRWTIVPWLFVEPSGRVIHTHEDQDGFTDTAGVAQEDYSFDVGTASFGGEVGSPLAWNGVTITPSVGLFGDYGLGDSTQNDVAVVPQAEDGWSARVTSGVRLSVDNGLSASIGIDYAGIGVDAQQWMLRAGVGMKF
jgi:hypothetical protein